MVAPATSQLEVMVSTAVEASQVVSYQKKEEIDFLNYIFFCYNLAT